MQAAAVTVVIGSYVAMLTGGLFHRMIFWCFWLVIMLYMLAYFILLVITGLRCNLMFDVYLTDLHSL